MPKAKLTKKQKGFAKDYAKTGIGVLAATNNYDVANYETANAIAVENLQKPLIQEEIEKQEKKIADKIPDDLLVERHMELLNKREVYKLGHGDGVEYEMSDQPDTNAVSKGLDMAYKIKGTYAPEKSANVNINVNTTNSADELRELALKVREQMRKDLEKNG